MDRLARLERAAVTDLHPQPIEQAIMCEMHRVEVVIGYSDFDVRYKLLTDSVAREFSRAAINQLEDRMAGAVLDAGPSAKCEAIRQEAERELPLKKILAAPSTTPAANMPAPGRPRS
jgi:hypothetical protein